MIQTFWMVDAFTHMPFSGNPAGVFIVNEFPDAETMQLIAGELNWSQTAFVHYQGTQDGCDHAHIRWFSPRDEAPICGHATLAASHILWEKGYAQTPMIAFQSCAGTLNATKSVDSWITLDFPLKPVAPCTLTAELFDALSVGFNNLEVESVHRDELIYVVTLKNQSDLVKLTPDLNKIAALDCRAVSVTTKGRDGFDFESRYFAPAVGIPEDPVCGSSHCRLAPLWSARLNKDVFSAYQASRRGGVLKIKIAKDRVYIEGQAVTVFESTMAREILFGLPQAA